MFRRDKNNTVYQSVSGYRTSRDAAGGNDEPGAEEPLAEPLPEMGRDLGREFAREAAPEAAPAQRAAPTEPSETPPPPVDRLQQYRERATAVARDTAFAGTLHTKGNLYIEGQFDGDLMADETIVIAEGARVQASMEAAQVIVAGTVVGTIVARARFQALPSAHVSGEIHSATPVIEQGAHIDARFVMTRDTNGGGQ